MVLAWDNLQKFLRCWSSFCCCCYSSFVDVLYSHFLFDIIARGLLPGFWTRFGLSAQPIAEWFVTLSFFNHSVIFLPRALRFWVGIFYPQALFTLCSFPTFLSCSQHIWQTPNILAQPAFIKVSLGASSYFFESCRTS